MSFSQEIADEDYSVVVVVVSAAAATAAAVTTTTAATAVAVAATATATIAAAKQPAERLVLARVPAITVQLLPQLFLPTVAHCQDHENEV